jgi:hypothetical protein
VKLNRTESYSTSWMLGGDSCALFGIAPQARTEAHGRHAGGFSGDQTPDGHW